MLPLTLLCPVFRHAQSNKDSQAAFSTSVQEMFVTSYQGVVLQRYEVFSVQGFYRSTTGGLEFLDVI